MYARGILFGKMVLELGDTCVVKNDQTAVRCDVEFKTKVLLIDRNERIFFTPHQGFFSGTYNNVLGKVRKNGVEIGEVSGRWSHVMEYKDTKVLTFLIDDCPLHSTAFRLLGNVNCSTLNRVKSHPNMWNRRTPKSQTNLGGLYHISVKETTH